MYNTILRVLSFDTNLCLFQFIIYYVSFRRITQYGQKPIETPATVIQQQYSYSSSSIIVQQ